MHVTTLDPADSAQTTGLLCAAFFDYPVMRYVLGADQDYAERLRVLISLFVAARVFRGDRMLGIRDLGGQLLAAALITLPGDRPPPPALDEYRERTWQQLGLDARTRYEAFGAAASRAYTLATPHHHLNMIGVDPSAAGRGFGRALLERVHALAFDDPGSAGVSLSTETRANLPLYRHFGYDEVGYASVGPGLETWAFFRPRSTGAGT